MSFHEGVDIELTRTGEGGCAEQSAGRGLRCKGGSQSDEGERRSWMTAVVDVSGGGG